MLASILRLWRVTFLFSNEFVVWMVLKLFLSHSAGIKASITHITSFKNVLGIEYRTSAVFFTFLACFEV